LIVTVGSLFAQAESLLTATLQIRGRDAANLLNKSGTLWQLQPLEQGMARGAWRGRIEKLRFLPCALGLFLAVSCGTAAPPAPADGTAGVGASAGGPSAGSAAQSSGASGAGSSSGAANPTVGGSTSTAAGTDQGGASGGSAAGDRSAGGAGSAGGSSIAGGGLGGGGLGGVGGAGNAGATTYPISDGKPTIYLAADSTVQTYAASQAPQQGWGQRIQEFFTADVSIVNKAIGGRSSKSFIDEGRLSEIEKVLKKGDYLFCQWGINDRYMSDPARYTDPATTFRDYLKQYIEAARGKNAIPVLVTPTPRLDYVNGVFMNDFPAYCDAIKAVGTETHTPVIDLQTKALAYYTSVGYEVVERDIALDVLHFKEKGAFEMARLVAEGTQELAMPISPFVK
jgi:lysophospholipase L1-like esterase